MVENRVFSAAPLGLMMGMPRNPGLSLTCGYAANQGFALGYVPTPPSEADERTDATSGLSVFNEVGQSRRDDR